MGLILDAPPLVVYQPSVLSDCATDLRKFRSVQLRSISFFIHNKNVAQRSINRAKKDLVPPLPWLAGCPIQSTVHARFFYTTHAGAVIFYSLKASNLGNSTILIFSVYLRLFSIMKVWNGMNNFVVSPLVDNNIILLNAIIIFSTFQITVCR